MALLALFEDTAFSIWMRESGPAFFSSLVLHSVSMGVVVGVHVVTSLRILGFAEGVPLSLMRRFTWVARLGLAVVVVSGALLLAAYPTKALTNPVFYLKLAAVTAALVIAGVLRARFLADPSRDEGRLPPLARAGAAAALLLWAGAITSGRFLAYTYEYLLASHVP